MPKGFARVAAVSLPVHLGDVAANEQEILQRSWSLCAVRAFRRPFFPNCA